MAQPMRRNLFALADRLGKTISEIEEITPQELAEWIAYFRIEAKERGNR